MYYNATEKDVHCEVRIPDFILHPTHPVIRMMTLPKSNVGLNLWCPNLRIKGQEAHEYLHAAHAVPRVMRVRFRTDIISEDREDFNNII